MRRASRSKSTTISSARRGRPPTVREPSALAELAGRFARFRREHPRGARVPLELRSAALAALKSGVRQGDLCRALGVSWSQVMTWKASDRGAAMPGGGEAAGVRVFSVVDAPIAQRVPSAPDEPLELRLGPWSVSVRLTGPAERG